MSNLENDTNAKIKYIIEAAKTNIESTIERCSCEDIMFGCTIDIENKTIVVYGTNHSNLHYALYVEFPFEGDISLINLSELHQFINQKNLELPAVGYYGKIPEILRLISNLGKWDLDKEICYNCEDSVKIAIESSTKDTHVTLPTYTYFEVSEKMVNTYGIPDHWELTRDPIDNTLFLNLKDCIFDEDVSNKSRRLRALLYADYLNGYMLMGLSEFINFYGNPIVDKEASGIDGVVIGDVVLRNKDHSIIDPHSIDDFDPKYEEVTVTEDNIEEITKNLGTEYVATRSKE